MLIRSCETHRVRFATEKIPLLKRNLLCRPMILLEEERVGAFTFQERADTYNNNRMGVNAMDYLFTGLCSGMMNYVFRFVQMTTNAKTRSEVHAIPRPIAQTPKVASNVSAWKATGAKDDCVRVSLLFLPFGLLQILVRISSFVLLTNRDSCCGILKKKLWTNN